MKTLQLTMIMTLSLSVIFLITSQYAFADTCSAKLTSYNAPQFYLLSDEVFAGTVQHIDNATDHQWKVYFTVDKIWRGTVGQKPLIVMTNDLQGCGYSIVQGEKYLVYTNGYPPFFNTVWSKPYADAQGDITIIDDPKFQSDEKAQEDLNKKLVIARDAISNLMGSKMGTIPFNSVGVDVINSTLDIGIDSTKAVLSEEEYEKKIKDIVGDIPIKITFGQIVADTPIVDTLVAKNSVSVPLSPLQQFKSGVVANNVVCKQGLQLIFKKYDGSPACVKPTSVTRLLQQGWANEIVTNTSTESSSLNKTTTNEFKIDLSNQTYDAGYPVRVNLKGVNQDTTCKIPSISVRDESDQSIVFGPTPDRSYTGSCVDSWPITFYAGLEKNTLITKSTRYLILATLDNKTYQKEFTVIPSLYSNKNITADSTQIMPGYLTFTGCLPVSDVPNNGTLISYTGFDMYRRYLAGPDTEGIPEIDDYLLKPGHTGSFVLQVHQGQFSKDANLAGGLYFLSENLLNLDNSTVLNNKPLASEGHTGLVLSYTPSFAKAGPEGYATITASISAQQNATRGTYWLYLPPGVCGGHRVLLTIGKQPLAQPPDYIGYDFASHFAQGVGNPTQSDVTFQLINAGIHTFENCSVNYVSENKTTTIKTFSVIPPGMEYMYHANLASTSKVSGFLECKNPPITKVYPDVWVDVIPY